MFAVGKSRSLYSATFTCAFLFFFFIYKSELNLSFVLIDLRMLAPKMTGELRKKSKSSAKRSDRIDLQALLLSSRVLARGLCKKREKEKRRSRK